MVGGRHVCVSVGGAGRDEGRKGVKRKRKGGILIMFYVSHLQ